MKQTLKKQLKLFKREKNEKANYLFKEFLKPTH